MPRVSILEESVDSGDLDINLSLAPMFSAILLIVILAIGDSSNAPPTEGMSPLILMWTVTGIGATLGWQTAYGECEPFLAPCCNNADHYVVAALNPIRDWGPRIALTIVGYKGLWSYQNGYFAYTPLASSMTGALVGAFLYDLFIYDGGESWLNKPWRWNAPRFGPSSFKKMPAAVSNKGRKAITFCSAQNFNTFFTTLPDRCLTFSLSLLPHALSVPPQHLILSSTLHPLVQRKSILI
jgi:hypothetical protein